MVSIAMIASLIVGEYSAAALVALAAACGVEAYLVMRLSGEAEHARLRLERLEDVRPDVEDRVVGLGTQSLQELSGVVCGLLDQCRLSGIDHRLRGQSAVLASAHAVGQHHQAVVRSLRNLEGVGTVLLLGAPANLGRNIDMPFHRRTTFLRRGPVN